MGNRINSVLSLTALAVAVGGATPIGEAAWNAVVPRNSVGPLQLQRNAVGPSKIAPNAVRASHVLDGSLLAVDFKSGQIPAGPKGDKGDKGDKGNSSATNVVVRWSSVLNGPAFGGRQAMCNAAEVAVGGGGGSTVNTGSSGGITLVDSKPVPNTDGGKPTGWHAGLNMTTAGSAAAYVICARP